MLVTKLPRPSLRPFVQRLWAVDEGRERPRVAGAREHVLPTAGMHLVFRLTGEPLCLFNDTNDIQGHRIGTVVVGGARSTYYIRDISTPLRSVGVQLRPGAAELLFGATAPDLSQRHTLLEELWRPAEVHIVREQLLETSELERQLAILESVLAHRLPVVRGLHPAVAEAIERFDAMGSVRDAVKQSGYSHRYFIALFRSAVGLSPKVYCRILRFHRALRLGASESAPSFATLALEAGYSDQSHFNRDFLEFTGVSPATYREIGPVFPHHLPVPSNDDGGKKSSRRAILDPARLSPVLRSKGASRENP